MVFTIFAQNQSQEWMSSLIFLGVFFVFFYLMVILPRRRQEKKHNELLQNLRVHDKIVTISGVYGEVRKIKENTLIIRIAENTDIEIQKNAVAHLQSEH